MAVAGQEHRARFAMPAEHLRHHRVTCELRTRHRGQHVRWQCAAMAGIDLALLRALPSGVGGASRPRSRRCGTEKTAS
jgi:hypothetical protein